MRKIVISSCKNFKFENGVISALDGKSFLVDKSGNSIVIKDIEGCSNSSSVSISNNIIRMNGFEIEVANNKIDIKSTKDLENVDITYNGLKLTSHKNDSPKQHLENEYKEYRLKEPIESVAIAESGTITFNDTDIFSPKELSFKIYGSGNIEVNPSDRFVTDRLEAQIKGSGDIKINDFTVNRNSSLLIVGSGDILVSNSTFLDELNLSIKGSGGIYGQNCKAKSINKRVLGSGDISGFKETGGL